MADLSQYQPLFPEQRVLEPLQELAATLVVECHRLGSQAGEPLARVLRPKLHAMNSYYTNKIEGQATKPAAIERALRKDFDADVAMAKKQRLAVAHIEVESRLEQKLFGTSAKELFTPALVCEIHGLLYGDLPASDRFTDDGKPIALGEYRSDDVTAGRHLAPAWKDVPALVEGWADRYRALAGTEALLIGVACSHHRLAWVHPFIDGNGTYTGPVVTHARTGAHARAVLRQAQQRRSSASKRPGWPWSFVPGRTGRFRQLLPRNMPGSGSLHEGAAGSGIVERPSESAAVSFAGKSLADW
jgi:fido (protein-threonine AMPylation protein)